jgi:Lrp/AsnC family transcriptional regulator, regulator for asnA, asnC and gidA
LILKNGKYVEGYMKNKKNDMDNIDLEIFQELQKDARVSSDELSAKLNMSSTTIRRRLRTMLKEDIIRIVAIGDFSKMGMNIMIGIHMEVGVKESTNIASELAKYKEVQSLAITSGSYNVSMLCVFTSMEAFQEFMQTAISNLQGVKSVETTVFLQIIKGRFVWGAE